MAGQGGGKGHVQVPTQFAHGAFRSSPTGQAFASASAGTLAGVGARCLVAEYVAMLLGDSVQRCTL